MCITKPWRICDTVLSRVLCADKTEAPFGKRGEIEYKGQDEREHIKGSFMILRLSPYMTSLT